MLITECVEATRKSLVKTCTEFLYDWAELLQLGAVGERILVEAKLQTRLE